MHKVYKILLTFGMGILTLSLFGLYVYTFININISKVLIPISIAFIFMVLSDYFLNGKIHSKGEKQ